MTQPSDIMLRAVSGVGWTSGSRFAQQLLQFGTTVILARILVPADFGLVGLILVFTGFANVLVDFGFAGALIQRPEIDEAHLSTAYWLNLAVGVALTALMVAAAPGVAAFYGDQRLVKLTAAMAPIFVLNSLAVVQTALLERSMNFRSLAVVENLATLVGGVLAIAAALSGRGVWSIVILLVGSAATRSVLLTLRATWRPARIVNRSAIRDLWRFSSNLAGFNAINYWSRNADNLIIGKVVGPAALGIYSRAYTLMLMPLSQITATTARVMFPTLSRIQHDPERVRRAYLRTVALVALVTFPMAVGMFICARPFILTIYGTKWKEVIPILRLLSVVTLTQSIGSSVGWIYQSQGRTDLMFRWASITGFIAIFSFLVGVHWGTLGVATAYMVFNLLVLYPLFAIPGSLIGMRFMDVLRAVRTVSFISLAMGLFVAILDRMLPNTWPSSAELAADCFAGIVVYWVLLRVFSPEPYRELRNIINRGLGHRVAQPTQPQTPPETLPAESRRRQYLIR